MLEIQGLRVHYGATVAVDGIDLTIGDGEAIALLGPNGAGKTSTLHAISRITPSKGRIVFDGHEVSHTAPQNLARRGLIHVPEGRRVFPNLTVHENLQVGQTARGGRTGYSLDEVYDLFTPLQALRKRAGWALSGGEQQMVAIGRGLVAAPRLLLLDEPSLGLAPVIVNTVYEALAAVKGTVPILLVEQSTKRALELCDRAHVLVTGSIVASGTAAEFSDRQALLDTYLGHTTVA